MPMIDADGCLLNVSVEGRDGGPTLMLSNSLGATLQMWEPQTRALTQLFRVVRYDRRGHGRSQRPAGPLFDGALRPRRHCDSGRPQHQQGALVRPVDGRHGRHWLGGQPPERLGKIVLANTACYYADPTNWLNRIKAIRDGGMSAVADTVIAAWLTADFREREPQIAANLKSMLLATPVAGYLACCEALSHARPARVAAQYQESDIGHRRPPRHVDAGRGRRVIRSKHRRRQPDHPRRGAYFQYRAAARLHGRGGRLPDAALIGWCRVSAASSMAAITSPVADC